MVLKACLNGARSPLEHPALPVTAAHLARAAAGVAQAGADAVHLHVKDSAGRDTLDAVALAEVLAAVRAEAPGLPIGVTTGAWALPDRQARVAAVRSWTVLPDFASVNWHEDGADDVAAVLLDAGIGVEAGLWHEDGVAAWLRSPYRDRCLRLLVELPDSPDPSSASARADDLLAQISAGLGDDAAPPVLLHGEGRTAWPLLRHAVRRGLATRIGLEDVLVLPDGTTAHDNQALVSCARKLATDSQ